MYVIIKFAFLKGSDLCPLEKLFQSIGFSSEKNSDRLSLNTRVSRPTVPKLPTVLNRSPSPPRIAPAPVPLPQMESSSAFSWTPSLLASRKICKNSDNSNQPEQDHKDG